MIELTSTLFESQLSLRALTFSSEMAACRTVLLKCYSELFEAAGSTNTIINKLIRQTSMNKDAKRSNRGRIKLCPRSLRLHTNAAFVQANAKNQRTALQTHAWPVGVAQRRTPVRAARPSLRRPGRRVSGRELERWSYGVYFDQAGSIPFRDLAASPSRDVKKVSSACTASR
jgi:hypothetical protein